MQPYLEIYRGSQYLNAGISGSNIITQDEHFQQDALARETWRPLPMPPTLNK